MIKVTLILLLGLGATKLARTRSAALRHWILAGAIVCAAAMPLAEEAVPAWRLAILPAPAASGAAQALPLRDPGDQPAVRATADSSGTPRFAVLPLLAAVWAAGAFVFIVVLAVGVGRLLRVAARAQPIRDGRWAAEAAALAARYGLARPPKILQTDHPSLLFTWGLRQPKVLLPRAAADWPDERVRIVLGHELAHISRGDWAMQLVAECLRSAYWFNPLVWIACRRLRLESEHACDDAVLRLGVAAPDYASQLLDLARVFRQRRRGLLPAPAMARPSDLERRVRIMLNGHLDRTPLSRSSGLLVVVALVALTVPIAGLSLAAGDRAVERESHVVADSPVTARPPAAPEELPSMSPAAVPRVAGTASRAASPTPAARPQATAPSTIVISLSDQNGRYIPHVPVVLSQPSTGMSSQVLTDSGGHAELVGLQAGDYQVMVAKPGFMAAKRNVAVEAGRTTSAAVTLQLGSVAETVVVQGVAGSRGLGLAPPAARHAGVPTVEDPCRDAVEGGCVTPPRKLTDVKPMYPARQIDAGASGVVVVEARILTDGTVGDLQPAPNSDPDFAEAAMSAIRQWQFSPTRLGGVPMEVRMVVTVNFHFAK